MKSQITNLNAPEFSSFIKKLLPIDKFIYIKIGKEQTLSSVYFPEKDAVKLVKVKTADLFTMDNEKTIKVSFYNGTKVIDALSHFSSEIKGYIEYDELDGELVASDFVLYDDNLKISLACADPAMSFMEMTKEQISSAFSATDSLFQFELLNTHTERMTKLFTLEKDEDTFKLYLTEKAISIQGKTFDAALTSNFTKSSTIGSEVLLYKKYIGLLDKENYTVTVCENKIIFKSLDTDTLLTVAVAISEG